MNRTNLTNSLRIGLLILLLGIVTTNQAHAEDATTPGKLRTYSTMQSIGIEWDLTGDANHNAGCKVQYRPEGSGKAWRDALALLRSDCFNSWGERRADRPYNLLAGSIFFLQPDTAYQVRLELADPDGGKATQTVTIRTRPIPRLPKGGKTYHVVPGDGGGEGSMLRPFQGLEAAQGVAKAGDVFLLHKGEYGRCTCRQSGSSSGKYIVWKAAGDGAVVLTHAEVAASHVWIEGLRFQGEGGTALRASTNRSDSPTDVVIRGNRFTGFHHSIVLSGRASNWYIADNVIAGDMVPGKPLPAKFTSGEGIELARSSGHVVAHNRISHVADGISYCKRNCDIYGNDIFDCVDDGVEPDYGYANNRIWGNRFRNTGNYAFSFQPQFCGPWYFLRNQVITDGGLFKLNYPMDRFVLVNNTFVCSEGVRRPPGDLLRSYSRNNLYISVGNQPVWTGPGRTTMTGPGWQTDVDYDGFDWGKAPFGFVWAGKRYREVRAFAQAIGIEKHAIRVRKEEIFAKDALADFPGAVAPRLLTLRKGSRAIDAGVAVPNLSDRFTGTAPDLGAYEYGMPLPHYGPRDKHP
jgi:hypothetical protein